jgi:hypothetical protein
MPLMTYKHTDTAQARMVACRGWGLGRALPDRGVPDFCTQAAPARRDPLPIAHARHPHHCAVPLPPVRGHPRTQMHRFDAAPPTLSTLPEPTWAGLVGIAVGGSAERRHRPDPRPGSDAATSGPSQRNSEGRRQDRECARWDGRAAGGAGGHDPASPRSGCAPAARA